jgi:hypothetical protein
MRLVLLQVYSSFVFLFPFSIFLLLFVKIILKAKIKLPFTDVVIGRDAILFHAYFDYLINLLSG